MSAVKFGHFSSIGPKFGLSANSKSQTFRSVLASIESGHPSREFLGGYARYGER